LTRGHALHHGNFAICILVSSVANLANLLFSSVSNDTLQGIGGRACH